MKSFASQFAGLLIMAMLACVCGFSTMAQGQGRQELKERFKQRDAEISRLKSDGKIGETWEGYVDVVNKEKALNDREKKLVDEENSDRRKLYDDIASKSDIRESPAQVGINNAMRNFASAKPDEHLKVRTGPWVTRGDVAKLKTDGKIGETWRGYIEAVTNKAADEARVAAVVNAENVARKYTYERQARNRKTSVDHEEERAGRQKIDNANSGDFVKEKDGNWVRKK